DHQPLDAAAGEEHQAVGDVLDDDAPLAAANLAALDGMEHAGIVAAGQVAHRAAGELHVDGGGGPDGAARALVHERLYAGDGAAEGAHDVDGVRVQRAQVEPRRALVGVI